VKQSLLRSWLSLNWPKNPRPLLNPNAHYRDHKMSSQGTNLDSVVPYDPRLGPCATVHNLQSIYSDKLMASRLTTKMKDHPFSAIRLLIQHSRQECCQFDFSNPAFKLLHNS